MGLEVLVMNNWYEIVSPTENISQGDILLSCPLLVPTYPNDELTLDDIEKLKDPETVIDTTVYFTDIIILSQACDLEVRATKDKPKLSMVMVAPLRDARKNGMGKDNLINTAKLKSTELFLLDPNVDTIKMGYKVINFDDVMTVPWKLLNAFSKLQDNRLRMKSPYIEHLSQHFANHFGRVGIPENREDSIVKFYGYKNDYETRRKDGEFKETWDKLEEEDVFSFISSYEK